MTQKTWSFYLVAALREDIAACEAELELLRGSLRYRVGGWLLEALPLGRRTFVIFFRVLRFYVKRTAGGAPQAKRLPSSLPAAFSGSSDVVVFGWENPEGWVDDEVWGTTDADGTAERLDASVSQGVLVIRQVDQRILRRVARLRRKGWRVVYEPNEKVKEANPALVAYALGHVDEYREL
jgi:hypothetical protein